MKTLCMAPLSLTHSVCVNPKYFVRDQPLSTPKEILATRAIYKLGKLTESNNSVDFKEFVHIAIPEADP